MTRARDELILSHAADYGGVGARRLSPFVLEALDLPPTAVDPGSGRASRRSTGSRQRACRRRRVRPAVARGRSTEPLVAELLRDRRLPDLPAPVQATATSCACPVAPHHAMIYGSALHKAVQEFHRRHARGDVMTEAELDDAFDAAWTNEGFLSREHEEARLADGSGDAPPVPGRAARARRGHPGLRRARVQLRPRRRPDPRPLGPGRHRARGRTTPGRRPRRRAVGAVTPTRSRRRSS